VQNAGDDDQYTLTSAHSTIADTVEPHHADTCMPDMCDEQPQSSATTRA